MYKQNILLRSACTYTGAGKLKEMPKRTTFIRVSQQLNEVFSGGECLRIATYFHNHDAYNAIVSSGDLKSSKSS